MAKIKIKNFGPIKEGFLENDGFIPIDKLMIFIGGQGSGKSSVVKLISTLTWLDKAAERKQLGHGNIYDTFVQQLEFQSIQNYIKENTVIEYKSFRLNFKYNRYIGGSDLPSRSFYQLPKIIYIPAERNFLSALEDVENVRNVPKSLQWLLDEYIKACRILDKPLPIHINNVEFEYNHVNRTGYISGDDFKDLKLSEASSGLQSVVPMLVVLSYLNNFIDNPKLNNVENLSFAERERIQGVIDYFKTPSQYDEIARNYLPQRLFTIIEEIELNLFPESQKSILYKTFEYNNDKVRNHLIITTHSPYIIAYTTLAMKAFMVKDKTKHNQDLISKISKIVPEKSFVNPKEVGIYQIDEKGNIISIKSERELILDNNYLNNYLEETNDFFYELLDIEKKCQ